MPVRNIPKNYRNLTGIAARPKAIGEAMFESTLERDFITLLEFDNSVESFEVQPVSVEWFDDKGKSRLYTPDVLANFVASDKANVLYEVKYRSELQRDWHLLRPKFKAAVRYANQRGWRFKVVTEKEIKVPRLDSAKFLLPFVRRGPRAEADMDALIGTIENLETSTPSDLLEAIHADAQDQARLMPALWYLVGTGRIGADLDRKITMSSNIWSLQP